MKKKLIIIVTIIILCVFSPYIKVEILTMQYGEMFELSEFEMVNDISYCKVMEYDDDSAEVLYVCKDELSILVQYEKESDEWKSQSWRSIWSSSGSADEFMWPMYR